MKNQTKFLIVTSIITMAVGMFIAISSKELIYGSFLRLEDIYLEKNINRLSAAFDQKVLAIDWINTDWAYWDDTYNFLENANQAYIDSNLKPDSLQGTTQIDLVAIADLENRLMVYYEAGRDVQVASRTEEGWNKGEIILSPEFLIRLLDQADDDQTELSGLIYHDNRPMWVSVKTVLHSDKSGPARGKIVMGKHITQQEIDDIQHNTSLTINIKQNKGLMTELVPDDQLTWSDGTWVTKYPNMIEAEVSFSDLFDEQELVIVLSSLRDIYSHGMKTYRLLVLIILISFAAVLVISYWYQRSFFHRIIRNLEASVADKTQTLRQKLIDEEKSNKTILKLLAESKEANEKLSRQEIRLEKSNQRLIHLSQVKDEFLSNVNHELRTPLTSIKMYLQLLLDGDLGKLNSDQKSALMEVTTASDHLLELIKEILSFKKMEQGKAIYNFQINRIEEVVKEVRSTFNSIAIKCQTQIEYQIDKSLPEFVFDKVKVMEIFHNLLSNALKYNRDNHPIRIVVSRVKMNRREYCQIECCDRGVGIKPEAQRRLFEKFYRADFALNEEVEGAGLGLSIVKGIVEAHKGTIEVESNYGEGTTFRIRLPIISGQ